MAGLAAERVARLARSGWTVAPLGVTHGFVATPWIEARPLTRDDAADARTSAPPVGVRRRRQPGVLGEAEASRGAGRVAEMLYWNARESLGAAAADEARPGRRRARRARRPAPSPPTATAAGAARVAAGRRRAHAEDGLCRARRDHTAVGRQPIAWYVAGAVVEWGLDAERRRELLGMVERECGVSIPPAVLAFHCAAYARCSRRRTVRDVAGADGARGRARPAEPGRVGVPRRARASPCGSRRPSLIAHHLGHGSSIVAVLFDAQHPGP
jgi:hypothetical protein